jgi:hypothetical protein
VGRPDRRKLAELPSYPDQLPCRRRPQSEASGQEAAQRGLIVLGPGIGLLQPRHRFEELGGRGAQLRVGGLDRIHAAIQIIAGSDFHACDSRRGYRQIRLPETDKSVDFEGSPVVGSR